MNANSLISWLRGLDLNQRPLGYEVRRITGSRGGIRKITNDDTNLMFFPGFPLWISLTR